MTEAPEKHPSLPRSKEEEAPSLVHGQPPGQPSLSEQSIMEDGQLGAGNLEHGPERRNPEGTSGIPNPPRESR